MRRERLDRRLSEVPQHRLSLVVAPAGSGKTTLLAQYAAGAGVPVAWYLAERGDDVPQLLRHLRAALEAHLGELPGPWTTVEGAATVLEARRGPPAVLAIDDLHVLGGTAAEGALERLIDYLPASLSVMAASRSVPGFNLSRLRLTGELLELGADDLRFRSWEVERLFHEFYGEPMPPEDLAELARRTEGWAAGLQLFHLATRGKSAYERRQTMVALRSRLRLVHEYLTRNVIGALPPELREFLVATCVLGRLDSHTCDRIRGATDSARMLEELERRQIFTQPLGDGGYRYHEVLRIHLEGLLVEEVGETRAQERYIRAGALLEEAALPAEAVRAYCRAERWDAVDRLLGRKGPQIAGSPDGWIDTLHGAMLREDAWVRLATARRHRAAGRWSAAVQEYQAAERIFGETEAGAWCRQERLPIQAWLDFASVPPVPAWWSALRVAVSREPLQYRRAAARLQPAERLLVTGLLELLAGRLPEAISELTRLRDVAGGRILVAAGRIALGAALLLAGDRTGTAELEAALEEAEELGQQWLARLARALVALGQGPGASSDAAAIGMAYERQEDPWGAAVAGLVQGVAAIWQGENPAEQLERVVQQFHHLGASVPEAWARAYHALALGRADLPGAREAAEEAEMFARWAGTRAPRAIAYLALMHLEPDQRDLALATRSLAAECGLALPELPVHGKLTAPRHGRARADLPAAAVSVRCFGGFSIEAAGRPVDLSAVKPRARTLLRILALQAGRPVHREVLLETLWPDSDAEGGARNLHVAVSSLRRVLQPPGSRNAAELIVREGDAYRLALAEGSEHDLLEFDGAVREGRLARRRGDHEVARPALRRALALHIGELLPEDGPADWVVERRERYRAEAAEVALELAQLSIDSGELSEAVLACSAGIAIDRYSDALWKLMVTVHEAMGDRAAAARTRQGYDHVLGELGVPAAAKAAGRQVSP